MQTMFYEFDKWDDMMRFVNNLSEYNFDIYILTLTTKPTVELRYFEHALTQSIITKALIGCNNWMSRLTVNPLNA